MENLTDTPTSTASAHSDVQTDDDVIVEIVIEDDDDRFEALWNEMNTNNAEHVAGELQEVAGDLMLFALNGYNGLVDTFANDTGAAVKATRAAIALCRAALDEIESAAAAVVRDQRDYHQRELDGLNAAIS